MFENELHFWKRVLERVDPVVWVTANLGFDPWNHQKIFLRDALVRTRVVRKSRQVGMTTTISHEALWKALSFPRRIILIISPGLRQSRIPMDKIHSVITNHPRLASLIVSENRDSLQFTNGSSIVALPNNPERIRGYDASDIYLDEAAHFLNDELVMQALKPMLISKKGTFTVVSTPFGKRGLFWDQYRKACTAQTEDTKVYDWYPSTINPLITKEGMERERLNLTELEFKQEYLGEFIEQVDTYLPLDLISACVDPSLVLQEVGEAGCYYVMGVDFAKQRDETVVCILEWIPDGILTVRHIDAWAGMNYQEQIGRIKRLSETFPIVKGAADQTGVGEAVIEDLREVVPIVEGFVFTQKTKLDMVTGLRSLLERKQLRLPNHRRLIMQLNSLRYTVSKTGNLLFDSPDKATIHDDHLWALALACYAGREIPYWLHGPIARPAVRRH